MKKSILILILSLFSVATLTACSCKGCGDSDGGESTSYSGELVIGGDKTETKGDKVTISNAKDLHLTTADTAAAVVNSAYYLENGVKTATEIDVSGISFGTPGEYTVRYYVADVEIVKKAFVYGAPTISGESTVEVTYSKAYTDIFKGITAKDSFGAVLGLEVSSDGGMNNLDGSLNTGTFHVVMTAIDNAGQRVSLEREVTVVAERIPEISGGPFTFDVNAPSFSFTLADLDVESFIGVSIGNKLVAVDYLSVEGNTYTVDCNFFYDNLLNKELVSDLENGDSYELSVITSKGRKTVDFLLTDCDTVCFEEAELDEFLKYAYPCGERLVLPQVVLANKYQDATPVYTVEKDGVKYPLSEFNYICESDGAHKLHVQVRDTVKTKTLTAYYDLGLENSTVYGESNPFQANLPEGYSLEGYVVTKHLDASNPILTCTEESKIEEFADRINRLNAKYPYDMTVVASKDSKRYKQTVSFTVVKNGISALGNSEDNKVSLSNSKAAYLKYQQIEKGGRRGLYRWGANTTGVGGTDSKLIFGSEMRAALKKDSYLTFDIYYTDQVLLYLTLDGRSHYMLWANASYYASSEDDPDKWASEAAYCGDLIEFYDADGNKIERKNEKDNVHTNDGLRSFKNQWITVQFKIEADTIASTAGFYIHPSYGLDTREIYFTNMRVSSASLLQDDASNEGLQDKNEMDFVDIWKKEE